MRIKVALAVGLTLIAIAVLAVLQRSPLVAVATNRVQATTQLTIVQKAGFGCQGGESLPPRISAIRLSFVASTGPRIAVTLLSHGHAITGGAAGSGWYGSEVTVPLKPLPRAHSDVTICERFGALTGVVGVAGEPALGGSGLVGGRLAVAYLRPSGSSWWSLAGTVIDHLALGRAASGTWIVLPIVALIATAIALATVTLARELR
jgi:hypothetical protein